MGLYIARLKNWIPGEVLTAADLNNEFDNCIDYQIPEPSGIAQGDILYRDSSVWAKLAAGTAGKFLETQGPSANPTWTEIHWSVRDATRHLKIINNATHPDYQLDITADEILMQKSDGRPMRATSFSVTVDISVSGANGLDTGTESASTWYYLWAIAQSPTGTKAGLISTSATAPTLPTGYYYMAFLGAIFNNSSSNFVKLLQRGHIASSNGVPAAVSASTATGWQTVNTINVGPGRAKIVSGWATITNGTGSAALSSNAVAGYYDGSVSYGTNYLYHYMDNTASVYPQFRVVLVQDFYIYFLGVTNWTVSINTTGWEF